LAQVIRTGMRGREGRHRATILRQRIGVNHTWHSRTWHNSTRDEARVVPGDVLSLTGLRALCSSERLRMPATVRSKSGTQFQRSTVDLSVRLLRKKHMRPESDWLQSCRGHWREGIGISPSARLARLMHDRI
jgi:hypothetical protein